MPKTTDGTVTPAVNARVTGFVFVEIYRFGSVNVTVYVELVIGTFTKLNAPVEVVLTILVKLAPVAVVPVKVTVALLYPVVSPESMIPFLLLSTNTTPVIVLYQKYPRFTFCFTVPPTKIATPELVPRVAVYPAGVTALAVNVVLVGNPPKL